MSEAPQEPKFDFQALADQLKSCAGQCVALFPNEAKVAKKIESLFKVVREEITALNSPGHSQLWQIRSAQVAVLSLYDLEEYVRDHYKAIHGAASPELIQATKELPQAWEQLKDWIKSYTRGPQYEEFSDVVRDTRFYLTHEEFKGYSLGQPQGYSRSFIDRQLASDYRGDSKKTHRKWAEQEAEKNRPEAERISAERTSPPKPPQR